MASSGDHLLRLQRTAYMTPRRRSPSIVDAVDRPREQTTPFSPENIYPTPPESSPWQACHQTESATTSRPAPLKLLGGGGEHNAVPQTPQRRVDVGIHSSFTPFHDIKQDIDKLIGELPTGFEDLVKSKEETVVERSEIRNGKHLSLFLYSPSKKKPLEPTREDVFGSGEGFELIGEETLALPCINSSAPTDLERQQQPLNRSLLSKASCVFKKTIKFIVPRGLHRLSRDNTLREMRLGGGEEAKAEEEAPRPIQLPPKKKARSIPMRNPPPGCCHHSQQQTLPTSTPGASNSILLLPIMSNNSISSPPQRRRRQEQPQQPKSSIRRKPVPKVPPPKYPAAATTPDHVATTIRGGRRRSDILRIHNVPSYIVHQDDFFHPPPPHHHHRFSPPESKSNSSSNRIQSLHASIHDFDIDVMMPDHHHHHQEKEKQQQQQQQKAQKGQKILAQIPLSQTPLYIQAAASLCIMAIAAGADFLVEDDSSYGYYWGVGRKMGSWRRRVGSCKISERRR
ncbi:uncharacterized protein SEPMUDRAFT_106906 [Sphaerulina musiva SO2202]|uniref:Uncharacterized protein n=1 Tax=Sphaerulina musiva (strain SO2202) TaxID=692275 RepID=M3D9R3_SPHMS|nr:uncharacterized protein SEPMUDRAFT_106906 [Sphaerulina musiva SO2202]EMF14614.1 hypothetical protein SEPMUDRAFT_106906 [Sphaerulina musiva SO2202]